MATVSLGDLELAHTRLRIARKECMARYTGMCSPRSRATTQNKIDQLHRLTELTLAETHVDSALRMLRAQLAGKGIEGEQAWKDVEIVLVPETQIDRRVSPGGEVLQIRGTLIE